MRKTSCLLLGIVLVFSMTFLTACGTEEKKSSKEEALSEEPEVSEKAEEKSNPKTYKMVEKEIELLWETTVEQVEYEMQGSVEGTTETYIRELTEPKYQGRTGGSEGNRLAADYLEEELRKMGLQQLPGLGSWKQSYETAVTSADKQGTAENVIGYLPGKDHTKAVVLGANFDGAGQCGPLLMPGAYNNASGVATLLQTAKWLATSGELPCDVIFAAFNTENNSEKGSDALAAYMEKQYVQIRMVNLKCLGWKGQPLTVYGASSEINLRKSLAGGLGIQYADLDMGGDEAAFRKDNMSSVVLSQDAYLNNPEVSSVLNSTGDVPENLDFAMLDETAKKLAAWVVERGDEPLVSYVVYW